MLRTVSKAGDAAEPSNWPARFKAQHGRPPRILHICNIANYAWVNASIMRRNGVDCTVLDPDFYHVASTPEWVEADINGDHGDDFYPDWRGVRLKGFTRPNWFINGPMPFVMRELAAREAGNDRRRMMYRRLSEAYRWAVGAQWGEVSPFRRLMEGQGRTARLAKAMMRTATLGRVRHAVPLSVTIAGTGEPAIPPNALPKRVPVEVLRAAMEHFDVIVGYTLGARLPAALGFSRFVSVELGTIRGLPFEDSDNGRLCAWIYRTSPEVFITNVDCIEAADRLGIANEARTPIPHPFDLSRAQDYARDPEVSPFAGEIPYIFCPARHHWHNGNSSWLKGNDILIQGAALAAARGLPFRLIMVDWGQEVALSRALISNLGITERVTWIKPLSRLALWPIICGAAAVADQFAVPAFGGVGLEAMALGRRVISRIEGVDVGPFFSRPPPFLHAATDTDVAHQIAAVLDDPEDAHKHGAQGQDWMLQEHGVERQLALQFAVFERLVTRFGPAG
jgi:glycosyltransferase involved in cell wall biosynthesis